MGNCPSCLQSLRGIITQFQEEFNSKKGAVLFNVVTMDCCEKNQKPRCEAELFCRLRSFLMDWLRSRPGHHGYFGRPPIELGRDKFCVLCTQDHDPMALTQGMKLMTKPKRFLENRHDRSRVIICRDAVDGKRFTSSTFMHQHQLATRFTLILVPALLHRQPDGL